MVGRGTDLERFFSHDGGMPTICITLSIFKKNGHDTALVGRKLEARPFSWRWQLAIIADEFQRLVIGHAPSIHEGPEHGSGWGSHGSIL
jgi:hypothetical protein